MKNSILLVVLFSLWIMGHSLPTKSARAETSVVTSTKAQQSSPQIWFAVWKGNKLFIYGQQFAEGAVVVINGKARATVKSDSLPPWLNFGQTLIVKNAHKKLAADELITINVRNPEGELSEDFIFYSGTTVGFSTNSERVLHLKVGERFLVFYPNDSDIFNARWHVSFYNNFPTVIQADPTMPFIPRSLGFFQAIRPGNVALHMDFDTCPGLPCGSYAQIVGITIFVE